MPKDKGVIILDNNNCARLLFNGEVVGGPVKLFFIKKFPVATDDKLVVYNPSEAEISQMLLEYSCNSDTMPIGVKLKEEIKIAHEPVGYDIPLFSTPPSLDDITQGAIADCYLLSVLQSLAATKNGVEFIQKMIKDNGDGTVTMSFFNDEGKKIPVSIDKSLRSDHKVSGSRESPKRAKGALWVSLIEKGFAAFFCRGDYDQLGAGGTIEKAWKGLTGKSYKSMILHDNVEKGLQPSDEKNIFMNMLKLPELMADYKSLKDSCETTENLLKKMEDLKGQETIKSIQCVTEMPKKPEAGIIYIVINPEKKEEIDFNFMLKGEMFNRKLNENEIEEFNRLYPEKKDVESVDIVDFIDKFKIKTINESIKITQLFLKHYQAELETIHEKLKPIENGLEEKILNDWISVISKNKKSFEIFQDLINDYTKGHKIFVLPEMPEKYKFMMYKNSYIFVKADEKNNKYTSFFSPTVNLFFVNFDGTLISVPFGAAATGIVLSKNIMTGIPLNQQLSRGDLTKLREAINKKAPEKLKLEGEHRVIRMDEAIALFLKAVPLVQPDGKPETDAKSQELLSPLRYKEVITAVVKFLKESRAYPGKRGSGLYTPQQQALYDELKAALATDHAVGIASESVMSYLPLGNELLYIMT